MRGTVRIPLAARRFLLGAFVLYLFGLLGYLGTSHRHADEGGRPGAHQDCQLCQVVQQPFAASAPQLGPGASAAPVVPVEAARAPILASRRSPFSSRAPPSA